MAYKIIVMVCAILGLGQAAFVDTLTKCSLGDGACMKNVIQSVVKDVSKTGVKELDIPPFDPVKLTNVSISILDLFNVTLVEGVVKGIKDCVVHDVRADSEEQHIAMELICDLTIKGKFKLVGSSPVIQNVLGGSSVHGDGNIKIKLDKLHLTLEFFYEFIKKDDGEIYMHCKQDKIDYKYDLGGLKLSADKIFVGDQDVSAIAVSYINENWKITIKTFGKHFFDVAIKITRTILRKFFDVTPAQHFVLDDLETLIKN